MTLPEWAVIDPIAALGILGLLVVTVVSLGIRDVRQQRKLLCTERKLLQTEQELQHTIARCGHGCHGSTQPTEETQ